MNKIDVGIKGLQEAQAANLAVIAAFKPRGVMEEAIKDATTQIHKYLVSVVHVDTGA